METPTPPVPSPATPPVPVAPPIPAPIASQPMQPVAASASVSSQSMPAADGMPSVADDNDLIEKEWVAQIKRVVGGTASDPFEQSRQFSKLKADYMQKRYGKVIKADE